MSYQNDQNNKDISIQMFNVASVVLWSAVAFSSVISDIAETLTRCRSTTHERLHAKDISHYRTRVHSVLVQYGVWGSRKAEGVALFFCMPKRLCQSEFHVLCPIFVAP